MTSLLASSEGSMGLLQKAIEEHEATAVTRRLEEYDAVPKLFHYSDAGPNCVAVGNSPCFRVHDVNFGFGWPERSQRRQQEVGRDGVPVPGRGIASDM